MAVPIPLRYNNFFLATTSSNGGGDEGGDDEVPDPNLLLAGDLRCKFALEGTRYLTYDFSNTSRVYLQKWRDVIAGVDGTSNNFTTTSKPYIAQDNQNFVLVGGMLGVLFDKNAWFDFGAGARSLHRALDKVTYLIPIYPQDMSTNQVILDISNTASNTTRMIAVSYDSDGTVNVEVGNGANTPVEVSSAAGVVSANPALISIVIDIGTVYGSDAGGIKVYKNKTKVIDETGIFTSSGALTWQDSDAARFRIGADLSENNDLDCYIAGFWFYNEALTEQEIFDRYEAIQKKLFFGAMDVIFVGDSNTFGLNFTDRNDAIDAKTLTIGGKRGVHTARNYGSSGRKLSDILDLISCTVDDSTDTITLSNPNWATSVPATDYTYITFGDGGSQPGGIPETTKVYPEYVSDDGNGNYTYVLHLSDAARDASDTPIDITSAGSNVLARGNRNSGTSPVGNGFNLKPSGVSFGPGARKVNITGLSRNDIAINGTSSATLLRWFAIYYHEWTDAGIEVAFRTPEAINDVDDMVIRDEVAAGLLSAYPNNYINHLTGAGAQYMDDYLDPENTAYWQPDKVHTKPALVALLAEDCANFLEIF